MQSGIEKDGGDAHLIEAGPADNQIFQNPNGAAIIDDFNNREIEYTRAVKSSGSGITANEQIRARLEGQDDHPLIYFTEDCPNTIRTLPMLLRDEIKREELMEGQEDHCLVAGTLVTTREGDIPIEQVRPGMEVATRVGWNEVEAAGQTGKDRTVFTIFFDDRKLTGTAGHLVYTKDRGWELLGLLKVGDSLVNKDGSFAVVEKVHREDEKQGVFNLQVKVQPEYYANNVLVHNCYDVVKYTCLDNLYTPPSSKEIYIRNKEHARIKQRLNQQAGNE